MTTSLGKRSSVNGISDIAYSDEKAPIYTSTNQFVQGTKTYNASQKFLSDVLCSGFYYGDGSLLTNVAAATALVAASCPYSGLTGTVPIWDQNTTGNALTATTADSMLYSGLFGPVPVWDQNTTGNALTATTAAHTPYSGLTGAVPTWNQSTTGNALTATTAASTPYSGLTGAVPTWNQNTTGNAATATQLTVTEANLNATYYPTMSSSSGSGVKSLFMDSVTTPLTYNPSTNMMTTSITGNAVTATSSTDSTKLPLTGGNINGSLTFSGGSREIVQTEPGQFLTLGTNLGCYPLVLRAQGSTALYLNGNTISYNQPLVPNISTSLPTATTQIGGSATVTGQSLNRANSSAALSFANVSLTAGVWNLRGHLRVINAGIVSFQPTQWGSWFNTSVGGPVSAPYNASTGGDYFFASTGQPSYIPLTLGVVGEKTGSTSFTLTLSATTTIYQCCYLAFAGGGTIDAYMTLSYTRVA